MKDGTAKVEALDRIASDASLVPSIRDFAAEQLAPLRKDQVLAPVPAVLTAVTCGNLYLCTLSFVCFI